LAQRPTVDLCYNQHMQTFFARHSPGVDQEFKDRLWKSRLVAVHFPKDRNRRLGPKDNPSLDPADYTGVAKGAIRRMQELSKQGGYVCAEYKGRRKNRLARRKGRATIRA